MEKSIGTRLREAREAAGLKQKDAIKLLGISKQQTLSSYENDRTNPPLDILKKMCEIYNVTADYLLFGNKTKNSYTLADFAKILADLSLNDNCSVGVFKRDETSYPGILIRDEKFGKFIMDLEKMRSLLKGETIDFPLFSDWFSSKLSELEMTTIGINEE